jgi:histidinol-phosphate aminotransferase
MFSERLNRLTPYVPGEQPRDKTYIKLNTNENPYPPSPKVDEFLKAFPSERLRLYPDPNFTTLRQKLGEHYQISPDRIFVGNGSDEVLSFIFFAFFDNVHGKLLFPEFTYSFYPVYCDFYAIAYEQLPLDSGYGVDMDGFLKHPQSCGVIFPNPNAPTGHCLELSEIKRLMDNYPDNRVVAIDEAYIDFGGTSAIELSDRHPNLIVTRTFSKSMSLAGLRIGFAIGSRETIKALYTVKDSFNSYPAGMLAQAIAEVAVSDTAYYQTITSRIIESRGMVATELKRLGWEVLPSRANFVFARLEGVAGKHIYQTLREQGVLVRHFDKPGIDDFVRITIGTPEQMNRFIAIAENLLKKPG